MKQRVSAVVRRSSAAPAAGSFGNKDLHTDTAVVHAPSLGAGGPGRVWGWPDGSKAEWSAGMSVSRSGDPRLRA